MNESSEEVVTTEPLNCQLAGDVRNGARRGCNQTKAAVTVVVVTDVELQHSLEMVAADDEQVVGALAPNGADPSFRIRVGHWRSYRRADDLGPDGAPDVVEGAAELGVSIPWALLGAVGGRGRPWEAVGSVHGDKWVTNLSGHRPDETTLPV